MYFAYAVALSLASVCTLRVSYPKLAGIRDGDGGRGGSIEGPFLASEWSMITDTGNFIVHTHYSNKGTDASAL